jgi:hypothetical protein
MYRAFAELLCLVLISGFWSFAKLRPRHRQLTKTNNNTDNNNRDKTPDDHAKQRLEDHKGNPSNNILEKDQRPEETNDQITHAKDKAKPPQDNK